MLKCIKLECYWRIQSYYNLILITYNKETQVKEVIFDPLVILFLRIMILFL